MLNKPPPEGGVTQGLEEIKARIESACHRSKRSVSEIRLIAVAKGQPVEKIAEAIRAGVTDIGENYVQEMLEHREAIGKSGWLGSGARPRATGEHGWAEPETGPALIHWHFIGHLQKNKVRKIIDDVELIHAVDSPSLVQEIHNQAKKVGKEQSILLEINLGQEESKSGFPYSDELFDLIPQINELDSVLLRGLMVIPPFDEDPEKTRPFFRHLREIRDKINSRKLYKNQLTELSMGMTHDFEVAIQEGATMVRIGTGIFGPRL
ncbi:MAG: YggS family pyridoxal phosphate-dependent enzyme [Deltaproteobacteria bacterium]|nr:YggS family pyridoxal phosphate-dependent enzyme [Deltaproteobacteria bacterium]